MGYTERKATIEDFEFLFELKKAAEYEAIVQVFGWDEALQRQLHENEWLQARPTIIMKNDKRIGSYLFVPQEEGYYFGRFFLLPEHQGKGIGSAIIESCIHSAQSATISLCYLIGNPVQSLYERYGFKVMNQDEHFVYMQK